MENGRDFFKTRDCGPINDIVDFFTPIIKPKFRLPIVQLLDPLKHWSLEPLKNGIYSATLASFRPEAWISQSAFDLFIESIRKEDKATYFMLPQELYSYQCSAKLRKKYARVFLTTKTFLLASMSMKIIGEV